MGATPPHGTVNQFAAGGRFPSGQSSEAYDCTVAVGVMALDAWTAGALAPSTTTLRGLQRDQVGGIDLGDLGVAYKALGVGSSWVHGVKSWTTVRKQLEAGRGVAVQGTYLALGTYRAPGSTFARGHALYLEAIAGGQVKVHDPLRSSPVWIPESIVKRFYYTGLASAGWFTSTYGGAGAGSSVGSGSSTSTGNVERTLAAFLGIPASTPVTDAHLRQAADLIATASGQYARAYPVVYSELARYLGSHPGILAGDFPIVTNAAGAPPDKDPIGDLFDLSFGWVPGVLVNGAVLVGVIALAYSGLNDVLGGG